MLNVLVLPLSLIVLSVIALCGCARYQYMVVEPAADARAIPRHEEITIDREPLTYALADLNRSLGVRIINPTAVPIMIMGERSYVVDPGGATQPMRTGTIAPHSYIGFTIPPVYTVYEPAARFGMGWGWGWGTRGSFIGTGFGSTWADYPVSDYGGYTTIRSWEWTTGDVRLHLEYDSNGAQVQHEFLLRRERVK